MKISFIALKDMPYIGGMEKYTEELGTRLVKNGHEVVIYTSGRNSDEIKVYKGMQIVPVRTLRVKGLERMIVSRIATLKAALSDSDVIHYQSFENTLLTWIPKLLGKKVVYQGHGLEWERDRWGKTAVAYFKTVNFLVNKFPQVFFNDAVVVSNYQKKYYLDTFGNNFRYIPTGINLTDKQAPKLIKKYGLEGGDYLFFAARLVKEKGAHYLIQAFKELKHKGNFKTRLVIAGDAIDEKEYVSSLKNLAADDKDIIFTGSISGDLLTEFFSNASLFILPSTIEGMPISLIEAMNLCSPTLSSDIGPNLEATANGHYGFHFKSRDVSDLSEKISELMGNIDLLESKRILAQEYVRKNFTWDKIYEEFIKVYCN